MRSEKPYGKQIKKKNEAPLPTYLMLKVEIILKKTKFMKPVYKLTKRK